MAFLDLDRICFDLERFKAERSWYNLNLTRQGVEALLGDPSWYCLQIPAEELVGDSYEKVRLWEEIAVALLKKYTERYYTFRKREWELPHLEYRDLDGDDPNFLGVKDSSARGLPHLSRQVAGGDCSQAQRTQRRHPEGRDQALGIPRLEGPLVRESFVPAIALS